jgi:hypothetical protein
MDWISKLFDISRLPFKIVLWLFVLSGIVLISSDTIINALKLNELLENYGYIVGITFLGSGVLVLINGGIWLINRHRRKSNVASWKSNLRSELVNLDSSEKAVLREFIIKDKHAIRMPMDNPTVAGLRRKGIIELVGQFGQFSPVGMLFSFKIKDEAQEYLEYAMIDLPDTEPTEDDIRRIRESRPQFATELERWRLFNY